MTAFGIDVLLAEGSDRYRAARVGLVGHPASVARDGRHSIDALIDGGFNVTAAYGPQHGMRGDVQDNMVETDDDVDPVHGIPVFSLYGEHRRPTAAMMEGVDVILFDLQDVGCRIYTYISTLKYFLEAAAATGKRLIVLDRPNPAGRPVDGLRLVPGEESFVGCDTLPTRHGLTVGELARWFVETNRIDVDLDVIRMTDYRPNDAPGFGWPLAERPWINPSPNASSVNMARCFPGTVLLEGTELSEGRGTTTPLELIGAPGFPSTDILALMRERCPDWLEGALIRPCYFEPTFHKHVGERCEGLQFHTDFAAYDHAAFRPFRLVAGLVKALRMLRPDESIWRHHDYEYEFDRIPIDVINGGPRLRHWVDDEASDFAELDEQLAHELGQWEKEREGFLFYS